MTEAELLEATGNIWRVHCYRDGNMRKLDRVMYIRAALRSKAQEIARTHAGCPVASAMPYDPRKDFSLGRYFAHTP